MKKEKELIEKYRNGKMSFDELVWKVYRLYTGQTGFPENVEQIEF